ncbi:tetratricopeptide repeat protein [Bradyrhizobium sp. 190]|uniref:tetratricopeptide repeat protein n=1 Tax=Bradyrhizobium sp. 190 TaxID=2782658 RepID=UPI001FFA8133|nr:tetratricopeptide repeat protein [Bradyrhizobium sp. 190]MCK1515236.1 tetratricopeptide repeat protein [Bradyrhizobium sp. 190]
MRRPSSHSRSLAGSLARFLSSAAVTAVLAAGLGGCQTMSDITASLTSSSSSPKAQAVPEDPRRAVEVYGERYRANPKDAEAALGYGQALRATGQRAQAAAVLEQATIAHSGNKTLLAAYGRALADNGNSQAAFDVLSRAHSPANPDWRILSVQGTTLDKMGKHEEARRYYATALKIVPEEPSVLSNLGLSYMLTRELPQAEETLRRAYSNPRADGRVRQNLALVVGLQGRFAEAETIAKGDLPADEATANVAYLREMLSRKDKDNSRPPGNKAAVPVAALNRPD